MNLCYDGHSKVYHEGKDCPACTLQSEIVELKEEIEDLNRRARERMRHKGARK